MGIKYIHGNLLDTNAQFICHQVNCKGKMNSGVAKQLREKWPIIYTNYAKKYMDALDNGTEEFLLGSIQIVPLYDHFALRGDNHYCVNFFSQYDYGYDGRRYTSYDAFWNCLNAFARGIDKGASVALPYKIGCDRGGANWTIIRTMIEEVLGKDFNVKIYYLNEEDLENEGT